LIAGLGVGGIAIGLAAQNIFEDLFASLSIILDKPFTKGDFVSFNGYNGNIERIGLKTTRIKALSGEQIVVSNANLLSNEIQNFKRMNERRGTFTVGVTYQTSHAALEALPSRLEDLIENQENCRFDRSHLSGYGASSIDFTTVYYVLSKDYKEFMDVQNAILLKVHALFEDMGVEFAYPTQTIFVERDAAVSAA
ncbi:MAG: mechanosensitive ion channel family protein, partial [Pseudomonadota bacterium]